MIHQLFLRSYDALDALQSTLHVLISSLEQLSRDGRVVTATLEMRRLRHRDVKWPAQGHSAEWDSGRLWLSSSIHLPWDNASRLISPQNCDLFCPCPGLLLIRSVPASWDIPLHKRELLRAGTDFLSFLSSCYIFFTLPGTRQRFEKYSFNWK